MKICIAAETSFMAQTSVNFLLRWLEEGQKNAREIVVMCYINQPDINSDEKEVSDAKTPIPFTSEAEFRKIFHPLEQFGTLSYVNTINSIHEYIQDSDLLVVSDHYQNLLKKVFLESMSDYILQETFCPVMVIPGSTRLTMQKAKTVIRELDYQI
ncbi:universal stress protein [Nostoc sp. FACHB-888]|uniref:universal stress protein n=1 Tax=Nostoc sp. FACHB-888 TaxID=2692842 RepID=UPI001688368D|nr:universal stress protein [Nostoc sp. FACHB-888]MBD2244374.1 universal stress protein [Nostoc sp. FACHB-888]